MDCALQSEKSLKNSENDNLNLEKTLSVVVLTKLDERDDCLPDVLSRLLEYLGSSDFVVSEINSYSLHVRFTSQQDLLASISLLYQKFFKTNRVIVGKKTLVSFSYKCGFAMKDALLLRSDEIIPEESSLLRDFVEKTMSELRTQNDNSLGFRFHIFSLSSNYVFLLFLESSIAKKKFLIALQCSPDRVSGTSVMVNGFKVECKSAHTGRKQKRRIKSESHRRKDLNRSTSSSLRLIQSAENEAKRLLSDLEDDDDIQPEVYREKAAELSARVEVSRKRKSYLCLTDRMNSAEIDREVYKKRKRDIDESMGKALSVVEGVSEKIDAYEYELETSVESSRRRRNEAQSMISRAEEKTVKSMVDNMVENQSSPEAKLKIILSSARSIINFPSIWGREPIELYETEEKLLGATRTALLKLHPDRIPKIHQKDSSLMCRISVIREYISELEEEWQTKRDLQC